MANISTLTVNLVAETAKFTVGLKKSQRDAANFGRNVKKALLPIATAAAATGTAMVYMARRSIDAADQLGKTAKAVNLSAETLQELRFAAQQTGIEVRGLDDSMRRFNRRVGEFATSGGGPAAKAIKDLGVNIRDSNGFVRSSEAIFYDVVGAMQGIESQAQRAAIAAQLFGDDFGPKLVPLLDSGAKGIEALRKEARELGIVMSNETVAGAERAKDTFGRLESLITGRLIKAFAENADVIASATEAMIQFTIETFKAFNNLRIFLGFETEYEKTKSKIVQLTEAIREANAAAEEEPNEGVRQLTYLDALDGIPQPINKLKKNANASAASIAQMNAELDAAVAKLKELEQARAALENLGMAPAATGTPSGLGGIVPPPVADDGLQRRADQIRESMKSSLELFFDIQRELDTLVEQTDLTGEEAGEFLRRMSEEIEAEAERALEAIEDQADISADDIGASAKRMSEFMSQAARNMQDAFAEFFFDPFDNGLKGMFESFVDTIRKMVANLIASDLLSLLAGIGGPFGQFFSLASGSLGPKAALGGYRRGRPFIAGDAGPEVITPGGSGVHVSKASQSSFHFETNINGGGGMDPETLLPILEENNKVLKAEFVDELRRGAFA